VKSTGDISAELVRGQKIEEHVTDLDLRNDENRPSLTSSAAAEEREDVSSKNTIDEMADAITGGNDMGFLALWPAKISEHWLKYETGSFWHCDKESFLKHDVPQHGKDKLVTEM